MESLICQLVHDVRQPLSNIQNCACYLGMVLRSSAPGSIAHVEMIERQVEEADRLLAEALKRIRERLDQRGTKSLERTNSTTSAVR